MPIKKKPCRRCDHGTAIHRPKKTADGKTFRAPCFFPGCKCKDYVESKTAA